MTVQAFEHKEHDALLRQMLEIGAAARAAGSVLAKTRC